MSPIERCGRPSDDPLSGTQLGPTLEGARRLGLEAQVGIQTRFIVPIGILIAIIWLPPFIALFSRG